MNRTYTKEYYLETLAKLYEIFPHATFGADVIVGFPGEEETDFLDTYEVIKKSPLNWLHIFPFSPRPGTKAENLKNKVPSKIIKERCLQLKKLISEKRKKFLEGEVEKERKVVLEFFDAEKNMWRTLSENYISTYLKLPEKNNLKGKVLKVKFIKLENNYLVAEPLKNFQNKII